ncbi:hypothetical protein QT971_28020 [Microcoleus sp. herbarium19]|uniref:hypothetical protein n=1 Tax=unclassified Microcoleus TaxID=2642155 RepID=UPI002FD6C3FC
MVDRLERHRTEAIVLTRFLHSQTKVASDWKIGSNCARQLGRIFRRSVLGAREEQ